MYIIIALIFVLGEIHVIMYPSTKNILKSKSIQ